MLIPNRTLPGLKDYRGGRDAHGRPKTFSMFAGENDTLVVVSVSQDDADPDVSMMVALELHEAEALYDDLGDAVRRAKAKVDAAKNEQ